MFSSKILLACIVSCLPLTASAVPDYQVSGDAFFNLAPPARRSLSGFGSIPLTGPLGSVSFAAAGTPSPALVANGRIGPSDTASIFGRASGFLIYSFEIAGPSGAVPILIHAAGGATAVANVGASFAVESRWDVLDGGVSLAGDDIRSEERKGSASFDQSFDRTVSLTLAANHVYSVFMLADVSVAATIAQSQATGNAFVDPIFSFGPEVDPQVYSLSFSNGIGNSAVVSEPDVVMVLSAGLFLVALLRWRAMA